MSGADKGQILPERVEEDLPKLQEALKARQLDLTLITTDVGSVTPLNEKVLRTAARLGVKRIAPRLFIMISQSRSRRRSRN